MRTFFGFLLVLLAGAASAAAQVLPACPAPEHPGSSQAWVQQVERLPLPWQVAAIRQRMRCDTAYQDDFSPALCRGLLGTLNGRPDSVNVRITVLPADTRPVGAPLLYILDNVFQKLDTRVAVQDFWRQEASHPIRQVTLLSGPAATAIYGMRGANGVVVLSSKNPKRR